MKTAIQVISILSKIEFGADVYEQSEARYLTQLQHTHPSYLTIICRDTPAEKGAYFHAQLTPRGKVYLKDIKELNEISRLPKAVH